MSPLNLDKARLAEIRHAVKQGRPLPDGLIAAEGPHLLEEAIHSAWVPRHVFCNSRAQDDFASLFDRVRAPVTVLSERVWRPLADTQHSQGVLTLLEPRRWRLEETLRAPALLVILDAVQDPGNVGTIARSAEAFGASGLLLTEGCARSSNGKVLRAASGSLFRIPFVEGLQPTMALASLQSTGIQLFALSGNVVALPLAEADLRRPCALVIGNEGAGVSPHWQTTARMITIPTRGVESLNAAVACSIALFEAARQRTQ